MQGSWQGRQPLISPGGVGVLTSTKDRQYALTTSLGPCDRHGAAETGDTGQHVGGCHAGSTPSRGDRAVMKLQDLKSRIVAALDYVNGVDRTNGRPGYLLAGDVELMRCTMAR